MAAVLMTSAPLPARWAFCRARTARLCSAAAKRRRSTLVTLGTTEDAQEFDSYTGGETQKKFILHYNFPNYSVGETGRISGPGRREIGHGALAERSIEPMLPLETYPYAVRVTSEIMESNGSTSMATVCGGTLALLDAGRSHDAARGRHQHRHLHRARRLGQNHRLQIADRHHRLGGRVLRHGLQDRRNGKGHHRISTRPQAARLAPRHHCRGAGKGARRPARHPPRHGPDPGRRPAQGNEQVRPAHRPGARSTPKRSAP